MKKWVYICSPYRGDTEKNTQNARAYARRAAMAGYIPVVPHLMYPQFMDDNDPVERKMGLDFGLELLHACDELWAFGLDSPTEGMKAEIKEAEEWDVSVVNGFEMLKEAML